MIDNSSTPLKEKGTTSRPAGGDPHMQQRFRDGSVPAVASMGSPRPRASRRRGCARRNDSDYPPRTPGVAISRRQWSGTRGEEPGRVVGAGPGQPAGVCAPTFFRGAERRRLGVFGPLGPDESSETWRQSPAESPQNSRRSRLRSRSAGGAAGTTVQRPLPAVRPDRRGVQLEVITRSAIS